MTAIHRLLMKIAALALCFYLCPAQAETTDLQVLLDSDDPVLQTEWAQHFQFAEGVPRDFAAAVRLYCLAARGGHAEAQYRLGWMYAHVDFGVSRDDALAAAWFRLAADQGDRFAERMLRVVGHDPDDNPDEASCVLPDGSVFREPPKSEPDPAEQVIREWVAALSPDYRLEPELVLAVIRAESNFDARARSQRNALGLMQLIQATADRFGVEDVWDPLENLKGGMAYLSWLLDHFEGDLRLALAGYNAGENAVHEYSGIPPYRETQQYVKTVIRHYKKAGAAE